mmetsp:Transcript_70006/g.186576  ORF Transcript_70006/g.186576 Transcript_70006/m.186576 type:complete len:317 (-) Transcript_70006:1008-1958(-)
MAYVSSLARELLHAMHFGRMLLQQRLKFIRPLLLIVVATLFFRRPCEHRLQHERADLVRKEIVFLLRDLGLQLLHLSQQTRQIVLQRVLGCFVSPFSLKVHCFHRLKPLSTSSQLLDLRGQSGLSLFQLCIDFRDGVRDLFKIIAFGFVHVGLLRRHILHVLLHYLVSLNSSSSLHLVHVGIDTFAIALQNLVRALQPVQLHPRFRELELQLLEMLGLLTDCVDILFELIALQKLVALHPFILLLLLGKLLRQLLPFSLGFLHVLLRELLLFPDQVHLLLVNRQARILCLAASLRLLESCNLVVQSVDITLQPLDI